MARSSAAPWVVGGLAVGVALLVGASAASTSIRRAEQRGARMLTGWVGNLIEKVKGHEAGGAGYAATQANLDGNGLSYGILQWTQKGGGLHQVLAAMQAADPVAFDAAFGGQGGLLLAFTATKSLDALAGARLWQEPWLSRFRAAAKVPSLQAAQLHEAASSEYMRAARYAARALQASSERALALYFDRAVQQGPGPVIQAADELAALYTQPGKRPATELGVLAQFGWLVASRFRRTSAPAARAFNKSGTIWWEQRSGELDLNPDGTLVQRVVPVWHAVGGLGDLWNMILRRESDILRDPALRDEPVDLDVV